MKNTIEEKAQAYTLIALKAYLQATKEFKRQTKIDNLLEYISKKEKEATEILSKIYKE